MSDSVRARVAGGSREKDAFLFGALPFALPLPLFFPFPYLENEAAGALVGIGVGGAGSANGEPGRDAMADLAGEFACAARPAYHRRA